MLHAHLRSRGCGEGDGELWPIVFQRRRRRRRSTPSFGTVSHSTEKEISGAANLPIATDFRYGSLTKTATRKQIIFMTLLRAAIFASTVDQQFLTSLLFQETIKMVHVVRGLRKEYHLNPNWTYAEGLALETVYNVAVVGLCIVSKHRKISFHFQFK